LPYYRLLPSNESISSAALISIFANGIQVIIIMQRTNITGIADKTGGEPNFNEGMIIGVCAANHIK
jgi:hypothetical protein